MGDVMPGTGIRESQEAAGQTAWIVGFLSAVAGALSTAVLLGWRGHAYFEARDARDREILREQRKLRSDIELLMEKAGITAAEVAESRRRTGV